MGDDELAEGWFEGQQTIDVGLRIDQPFTLSGDADDIHYDMSVSGTAANFYVGPPPIDETWEIVRILLEAVDSAFTDATDYGAINNGLPTGIHVDVVDAEDNILYHFTKVPIKTTYDWGLYAGVDSVSIGGAGADPYQMRWTFAKAGYRVKLEGARGMRLRINKPDDLTALDKHIVMAQGFKKEGGGG